MQELQNEVSSLLEFKNVLLQTFPDLHHKISGLEPGARTLSGHLDTVRTPRNIKTDHDISDDIPSSWNTSHPNTGSMQRQRKVGIDQSEVSIVTLSTNQKSVF